MIIHFGTDSLAAPSRAGLVDRPNLRVDAPSKGFGEPGAAVRRSGGAPRRAVLDDASQMAQEQVTSQR